MFINVEETKIGAITWSIPGIKTIEDVKNCLYFDFNVKGAKGDNKKLDRLDRGEFHFRTKYFDFTAFKAPYANYTNFSDKRSKNKKGDIILLARHTIDHTSLTLQLIMLTRKLPLWDKEILREMRLMPISKLKAAGLSIAENGKIKKSSKMYRGF